MSQIVLESVADEMPEDPPTEEVLTSEAVVDSTEEVASTAVVDSTQAPEDLATEEATEEARPPPPPPVPQPKKRGRPPKAKAEPKAFFPPNAPKPRAKKPKTPPDSSSDEEEVLRNVYNHVSKPDMETAILQFLVNRRQSETTRRRELWSSLARM